MVSYILILTLLFRPAAIVDRIHSHHRYLNTRRPLSHKSHTITNTSELSQAVELKRSIHLKVLTRSNISATTRSTYSPSPTVHYLIGKSTGGTMPFLPLQTNSEVRLSPWLDFAHLPYCGYTSDSTCSTFFMGKWHSESANRL